MNVETYLTAGAIDNNPAVSITYPASTKKKLRKEEAVVNQEYVEQASLLIVVCSNTSRSKSRYGRCGREIL
jgi:hypothetical protein